MLDHDESTYIVIADALLRGEVYLRDVIDTKPIGIFLVYGALIKLTGGLIPLLRLAATLVISGGAYGLYLAARRAGLGERVGIPAGLLYCVSTSIFSSYGLSPNTEIFFNLFTILAVALAVAPRVGEAADDPWWHWPVAGLLLGCAVAIKPFAAAESLALGLFLVYYYLRRRQVGKLFIAGISLVGSFTLPLLAIYLYYLNLDMLDTLSFYLFEVNSAYPVALPWYLRAKYIGDYLLRYSPLVVLGALALVQSNGVKSRVEWTWVRYFLFQFVLVAAVVLITGKRFGHYQVQLHPSLSAFAATWWFTYRFARAGRFNSWIIRYTPALLMSFALLIGTIHYSRYHKRDDIPTRIAAYLAPRLGSDETYFGLNGWQITYHLLDREVPTPYVHSSLLFLDHHVRAFQIDEAAEAANLLNNPKLTYLAGRVADPDAESIIKSSLLKVFSPVDTLEGDIVIYRRNE